MGFERLVRLMQGKNSNYDTDIFTPVIEEIERLSGKKYNHTFPEGPNGEGVNDEQKVDIAMRVVADHLRAVAFSIADGQVAKQCKGWLCYPPYPFVVLCVMLTHSLIRRRLSCIS